MRVLSVFICVHLFACNFLCVCTRLVFCGNFLFSIIYSLFELFFLLQDPLVQPQHPPSLPWGGGEVVWGGSTVVLTNTCPVDNLLTFLHQLIIVRDDIRQFMEASGSQVARLLLSVHRLMLDRQWMPAKVMWLQAIGTPVPTSRIVDVYGSEAERVLKMLGPFLQTAVASKCSEANCSALENVHSSPTPILRRYLPEDSFQDMVTKWWQPPHCMCVDADNSLLLPTGTVFLQHSNCDGMRTFGERSFCASFPPFVTFSMVGHAIRDVSFFPSQLRIDGRSMALYALTFHSVVNDHYAGAVKLKYPYRAGWWYYDGGKGASRMVYTGSLIECRLSNFTVSTAVYVA